MSIQKWKLISKKDVSPHAWFPIEMRTYKLPNGKIIDDFSVTTIPDVAMIVPVTKDKKVILVKQFKPGIDDLFLQFPAGRIEPHHANLLELAQHELEEEVGIRIDEGQLHYFATLSGFSTKGTEKVSFYYASDLEYNSKQKLDETEDIEIVEMGFEELDEAINDGTIWCALTIAGWELAKKRFML